jgi:hypothetical protein
MFDKTKYVQVLRDLIESETIRLSEEQVLIDLLDEVETFDEDAYMPKGIAIPDLLSILEDEYRSDQEKIEDAIEYVSDWDEKGEYR